MWYRHSNIYYKAELKCYYPLDGCFLSVLAKIFNAFDVRILEVDVLVLAILVVWHVATPERSKFISG
jgi:hypothetical protein